MKRYVGPQIRDMAMAKVCRLTEGGRMVCIPKMEATKLAGRNSRDMSVKMRMLRPWVTAVRASTTAEALKSCT